MTEHYERPDDPTGTVFDPTDGTFGPIMAAIKRGDFEQAADALRAIDPEPDHFEGNIGANIAGGRYVSPSHGDIASTAISPDADPRFWTLDFDERDHRADLTATVPVCIVDEEAGGIVAYAVSEDVATMIVNALSRRLADDGTDATWRVPYLEVKDSYRLAMESAGIGAGQVEEVLATVEDFAVNNLGDN